MLSLTFGVVFGGSHFLFPFIHRFNADVFPVCDRRRLAIGSGSGVLLALIGDVTQDAVGPPRNLGTV